MARRNNGGGMSPVGKLAIIAVLFGVPILFFSASWGLDVLAQRAPLAMVAIIVVVSTVYAAHTSTLLYNYYEVDPPIIRFVPLLGEVTLMDRKYWTITYILYGVVAVLVLIAFLPYSVASILGEWFVENHTFMFMAIALVVLLVIQLIKGVGLTGCINDIAADWEAQTHSDVGFIKRFSLLSFVPFVRVVALYGMNKPLDTMVTFMNVTVSDAEGDDGPLYEAEDDGYEEE